MIRWITLLVAAVLLAGGALSAGAAEEGKPTVQSLVTLFAAWHGDEVDPPLSNAAARYIDYREMSERVLGKPHWSRLSLSQQGEFVGTFRRLVEQRYYPRWHRLFYKGKLNYGHEVVSDGDLFVKTVLIIGKKEDPVVWRLHDSGGEWKVVSLSVGNRDLLRRLNERFARHLARDGFDGMLAWLKDKVDDEEVREPEDESRKSRQRAEKSSLVTSPR